MWQRWKRRRAHTKQRLAAMSPARRLLHRLAVIGTWILAFFTTMAVAAVVMFYAFTDVPRPEDIQLSQVATIEYADGSVMARVGSYNRTIVGLNEVPEPVRWAVLAAEDRGFYSEPGVSIKGTLRAAVSDVFGGDTQGGSGITQQYVKNAYPKQVGSARTLTRKLKELMIAIKLSREYSKNQILEYYLNTVYFGRGAYGIAAAARSYFGVDVSDLTPAQGALLAALLRAPGYYDPAVNRQAAVARWNYVLDGMVAIKKLTEAGRAQMAFPKVKEPNNKGLGTQGWRWLLVKQVFAELEARGISEKDVYANGLVIRTTISKRAQVAALDAIHSMNDSLTAQQRAMKNALVAVNPKNGAVLAYYGGTGLNVKGPNGKVDYNDYAAVGTRPAGSSFKPYTLATVLQQTLKGKGPGYAVNSYVDGSQCLKIQGIDICNDPSDAPYASSSITIQNAIKYSLNTTFDLLAAKIGPNRVADLAHAVGVRAQDYYGNKLLQNKDGNTGFGIGIGDYAVSPIDQAVGFATFANSGNANAAYFVDSATTSAGDPYYQHKSSEHRAIDPKVANDVTLALQPIAGWSGTPLADGRASAAKTGTVGIGKRSAANSDAWMVGYTPQVSAAVWVGTGLNKPIYDAYGGAEYGRDLPARTWKAFMDSYLAGRPMLSLADEQQIQPGDGVDSQPTYTPTPTPTDTPTTTPSTSSSTPSETPSESPTQTETSTTPTESASTSDTPTPTPTDTTANCGHLLQPACPTDPADG
jgi:membrane peptidoglycan carboxypeptidase